MKHTFDNCLNVSRFSDSPLYIYISILPWLQILAGNRSSDLGMEAHLYDREEEHQSKGVFHYINGISDDSWTQNRMHGMIGRLTAVTD
jgi:hypothetical protein